MHLDIHRVFKLWETGQIGHKDKQMRRMVLALLILPSACTTETIYMKNPSTGALATCGAHPLAFPIYATIAATHDHDCVQDYKEQGYIRVEAPK